MLENAGPCHLEFMIKCLEKAGVSVETGKDTIRVKAFSRPKPVSIITAPYPGFPTDLQAPWMSLMCLASGKSRIKETIFENRFMHAAELGRMGAEISVSLNTAVVNGVKQLTGAPVMASDIRAGAALVTAALAAAGRSEIRRVYHIDRGYERIEAKLSALGAGIERARD